uniref:Uncharacterized protein n=1 Tax=Aegilops tauschii subsp. strangulata TaxID=200361 RepID=A0A453PMI1_AEGTS
MQVIEQWMGDGDRFHKTDKYELAHCIVYKHYTTRIQYRVNIQLTAPIFSSFCRRTLGKIWSTNILFQQRTKGKSSRSTTQFLFRRIPFFK